MGVGGVVGALWVACESRSWPNIPPNGTDAEELIRLEIPLRFVVEADTETVSAGPVEGAMLGWLEDSIFGYAAYGFVTFPKQSSTNPVIREVEAFDSAVLELRITGQQGGPPPTSHEIEVYTVAEAVPADGSFALLRPWRTARRVGSGTMTYDSARKQWNVRLADDFGADVLRAYIERDTADIDWMRAVFNGFYVVPAPPAVLSGRPYGWAVFINLVNSEFRIFYDDSLSIRFPLDTRSSYPAWERITSHSSVGSVIAGRRSEPLWLTPQGTRIGVEVPPLAPFFEVPIEEALVSYARVELMTDAPSASYRSVMPALLTLTDSAGNEIDIEGTGTLYDGTARFSVLRYYYDHLRTGGSHRLFITLPGFSRALPARLRWRTDGEGHPRLIIKYRKKD